MNVFATDHPLAPKPMNGRAKVTVAGGIVVLIATVALLYRHIDGPRVVARAVTPDGTEFCVVQKCKWDFEFFTTSCYYRKPGGQWGWFYYDHQDWYWGSGRAEIDQTLQRISIFREGRVTVTFDWKSETYRLFRSGFPHRTFIGAQGWMPPEWSIAQKR